MRPARLPKWWLACAFLSPAVLLLVMALLCVGLGRWMHAPWTFQSFDLGDGREVRVIAEPGSLGDPTALFCEVWIDGLRACGPQFLTTLYDDNFRLQVLWPIQSRLIVLLANNRPHAI